MRTLFRLFTVAAITCVLSVGGQAEEKNGLLVSVTKKTLERNDAKSPLSTRVDRTQGLSVSVKNTSIRDFPVGELQWTIVVKRYDGLLYKYTGKEVVKALRPSMSTELVMGAAQTGGYRSDYANYKDKLEYEVIIVHAGKETLRMSSDQNFALLAKRATNMDRPAVDEDSPRGRRAADPLTPGELIPGRPAVDVLPRPIIPGRPDMPPVVTPGVVPPAVPPAVVAPRPPMPPGPAVPPVPGQTADGKPTEPKPAQPVVDTPPAPPAPPVAEQPPGKPYDFFNLDKGKKPGQ